MTGTLAQEYRDLERETSSQLLDHDSRRVLGRYVEAAYRAWQAGRGRTRMGQLCYEAEDYGEAVQDWLSAMDCFLLAATSKQAAVMLDVLQQLERDGRIPSDRPDLAHTIRSREQRLKDLDQRTKQLWRDSSAQGHTPLVADQRALRFLVQCVRDLPGYSLLHYAIFRQASDLGQQELADQHLRWAAAFDPDNGNLVALLGYLHLQLGRPDHAVKLGNDYLAAHSAAAGPLRIMLANALASIAQGRSPDQERAIEVLQPLVESAQTNVRQRIAALAFSATFQYELGREQEFGRLIQEMEHLEESIPSAELRSTLASLRAMIYHARANGIGKVSAGSSRLFPEEERLELFQKAQQLSVQSMEMAA